MQQPVIYFISGSIGAGKTTYALQLAEKLPAIRFSIDEWMTTLFTPDIPQPLDPNWIWERVERCERMIVTMAVQVAVKGSAVILDLGFTRKKQRQLMADQFRTAGLSVQLHWLDVDAGERWRRVSARNDVKGETYALTITRQVFEFMEARFEAPTLDELRNLNGFKVELATGA